MIDRSFSRAELDGVIRQLTTVRAGSLPRPSSEARAARPPRPLRRRRSTTISSSPMPIAASATAPLSSVASWMGGCSARPSCTSGPTSPKRPARSLSAWSASWRRRGIGSALFERLAQSARGLGYEKLRITTHPRNIAARAMARKFGRASAFRGRRHGRPDHLAAAAEAQRSARRVRGLGQSDGIRRLGADRRPGRV